MAKEADDKPTPGAASLRVAFDTPPDDEDEKVVDDEVDKDNDNEIVDDDNTDDVTDDDVDDSDDNADDDYTEEERQAMEQGWNPNYEGPNAVSAGEYLRRGSLFKKIESQGNIIKRQQKQLDFLLKQSKEAVKTGYEKALKELKDKKAEALANEDHKQVVEIDEEIADTKQKMKDADNEDVSDDDDGIEHELPENVQKWVDANPWYNDNPEMRTVADSIGNAYLQAHPELKDPAPAMRHVEKRIKELYPDEFGGTKRKKNAVEGGRRRQPSRKGRKKNGPSHSVEDLDSDARMVMNNMIRSGAVKSQEDYIKQLEDVGYFKN